MNNHPITPPPELVQQWVVEYASHRPELPEQIYIATRAAQWGADQELEACCKWVSKYLPYLGDFPMPEDKLRAARRPKPPSLKEQALAALERYEAEEWCEEMTFDSSIIRRALEAL